MCHFFHFCHFKTIKQISFHIGSKRSLDNLASTSYRLADNDVVLTTYNLVAKEVGAADINAEDPAKDEDPDEEDKKDEVVNLIPICTIIYIYFTYIYSYSNLFNAKSATGSWCPSHTSILFVFLIDGRACFS